MFLIPSKSSSAYLHFGFVLFWLLMQNYDNELENTVLMLVNALGILC